MTGRQQAIDQPPIATINPCLLPWPECEATPHQRSGGQKSSEQHIRAEVHVMVPIETLGSVTVYALELIKLRRHYILE